MSIKVHQQVLQSYIFRFSRQLTKAQLFKPVQFSLPIFFSFYYLERILLNVPITMSIRRKRFSRLENINVLEPHILYHTQL